MTNLENTILKLNHIVFWWYYKKSEAHFKQYTFIKSIRLLRESYNHLKFVNKGNEDLVKHFGKRMDEQAKELRNIKMQIISSPDVTNKLNSMFGTDFNNPQDN
jgi:hypothetical protein